MGNKVNALHDERMRIIKQMREINNTDGALTAEQDAKWQELDSLQDGLRQRIENEKKIEQIADSLAEIEEAVDRQPLKATRALTILLARNTPRRLINTSAKTVLAQRSRAGRRLKAARWSRRSWTTKSVKCCIR